MEDVPATIFTMVLLFAFIFSAVMLYTNYLSQTGMIEQKRVASSIAEKMFIESGGIISGLAGFENATNIEVRLVNLETGNETAKGSTANRSSVSSSSLAVTITENGKYYPGRLEVYAGG